MDLGKLRHPTEEQLEPLLVLLTTSSTQSHPACSLPAHSEYLPPTSQLPWSYSPVPPSRCPPSSPRPAPPRQPSCPVRRPHRPPCLSRRPPSCRPRFRGHRGGRLLGVSCLPMSAWCIIAFRALGEAGRTVIVVGRHCCVGMVW